MIAPDKIYVAESLIKTPYGNEWSPTPYISRENTEYIRKDVLINWLQEHINDYLVHGRDIDLMFDDIKNAF